MIILRAVLVTGGAGFIGSCLVRRLIRERACQVIVLDKLTYAGRLENLAEVQDSELLQFQRGDIGDKALVRYLLQTHAPDWVINLAAESHVDRSIDHPSAFVQTNVVGVCHLLEACLDYWLHLPAAKQKAFRVLQASTDEVFGSLGSEGQFTRTSPYAPRSPYAASKAAGDHFVRAFFHTYGLPTIVTNCSNNYGPYQYPEKLIPLMIRRAVEGLTLPVYGDGSNIRDWIHVDDHARGIEMALARGTPGDDYLFGGDCEQSNLSVVKALCDCLDRYSPRAHGGSYGERIRFVADRPGHDQRYAISSLKARQRLDWRPLVEFEAGLRGTVEWFLNHRTWMEQVTENVYEGNRLGLRPMDDHTERDRT